MGSQKNADIGDRLAVIHVAQESPATDRIAEAGLAQVDPERPKIDGFAVEKAHVEEVEGQNLLIFITEGGSNRGIPRK